MLLKKIFTTVAYILFYIFVGFCIYDNLFCTPAGMCNTHPKIYDFRRTTKY